MNIPNVTAKYLQHAFSAGSVVDNDITYNFVFSGTYISAGSGNNEFDGSAVSRKFIQYLSMSHNGGSFGTTAVSNAAAASGKVTFNNDTYNVVGISGYYDSTNISLCKLYIVYYNDTEGIFETLQISATELTSGYCRSDTIITV
jgi:hypothetical protein